VGVSPEEIEAGARMLLAQARGYQLAQTRKQVGLAQRDIAATMDVSMPASPRSNTAKSPRSRSSPVISKHSAAASTSSPTSATGQSACPSATPPPNVPAADRHLWANGRTLGHA
jgi:hypothetical protein